MRRTKAPSQFNNAPQIPKVPKLTAIPNKKVEEKIIVEGGCDKRYFSITYGKISNKKHKTWDGDGYLIATEQSVKIINEDKVQIGSMPRKMMKKPLEDGEILYIGGKMIEILNEVPSLTTEENNCVSEMPVNTLIAESVRKSFKSVKEAANKEQSVPDKENAQQVNKEEYLMPKPPPRFMFMYGGDLEYQDVYIEPSLASKMRYHQIEGCKFLYNCVMGFCGEINSVISHWDSSQSNTVIGGAILADAMGLGKSIQTIGLIWTLLRQNPFKPDSSSGQINLVGTGVIRRCLIVCPSSLVQNWKNEFHKWIINKVPNSSISVYCVTSDNRPENYPSSVSSKCPVMIISYEMCTRHADTLAQLQFDMLVCDEAHRLRNSTVQAYKQLAQLYIPRRVLLTGTPIQNAAQELNTLCELAWPGSSVHSRSRFILRRTTDDLVGQDKTMCHGSSRRAWADKNEYLIFCGPTRLQSKLYKLTLDCRTRYIENDFDDNSCDDAHGLTCILLLRKLCFHPLLFIQQVFSPENQNTKSLFLNYESSDTSFVQFLRKSVEKESREDPAIYSLISKGPSQIPLDECSSKLTLLSSMLQHISEEQYIVIASHFTRNLDIVSDLCDSLFGLNCTLRIDGNTSMKQRASVCTHFSTKSNARTSQGVTPRILLLSTKAGGEGLNLVRADRLILLDPDWNPACDQQTMARVWREGQQSTSVSIYRLFLTDSVEESILHRQTQKHTLSVLTESNIGLFNESELKDIFTVRAGELDFNEVGCWTHYLVHKDGSSCSGKQFTKEVKINQFDEEEHHCQLGSKRNINDSAVDLWDLSRWSHWCSPFKIESNCQDELLLANTHPITCIFHLHTNMSGS